MAKPPQVVLYKGEEHRLIVLCKERNKDPMLVRQRLRTGWDIEEALEQPSKLGDDYGTWRQYEKFLERNRTKRKRTRVIPDASH